MGRPVRRRTVGFESRFQLLMKVLYKVIGLRRKCYGGDVGDVEKCREMSPVNCGPLSEMMCGNPRFETQWGGLLTYLRLDTSTKCLKLFYTSPQPILG